MNAVFVHRTGIGAAVLSKYGRDVTPDYEKIIRAVVGKAAFRAMWTCDVPPSVANDLRRQGWEVRDYARTCPGLVECSMAVRAMDLPADVGCIVLVGVSGAATPVVEALCIAGMRVVVAGFKGDIARSLLNVEGASIVYLDDLDVTRPKSAPATTGTN